MQKKFEEDEVTRTKMIADKQSALEELEKKYITDIDRLDRGYTTRVQQLEEQRGRWTSEHDHALKELEALKTKTREEADKYREAYRQKEEAVAQKLSEKEKEFADYRHTVEQEWPVRFENRVTEIAEKARKQLAEKEAEFAEARRKWLDETTDMKMKLSAKMTELEESFTQREEDMQRRYLQKQHELTVQTEKAMSDLHTRQMSLEAQKSEYETLCKEADQRKAELEEAKKDLQRRLETLTQEFMRQQGIMDEQMRRLQNEKFELKKELENGPARASGTQPRSGQQEAA